MNAPQFESILIVFQNPRPGCVEPYDDWYTNIHIRDAMRLDGALATQRFIAHDQQLVCDGVAVRPEHWAHTIYEWESAAKSVLGHGARAGTPAMEISGDGSFEGLRDYFYRPDYLSHGWSLEAGFRRGDAVLTAMIVPHAGTEAAVRDWFRDIHAPPTLALPGFGSAALFSLHEEQSLPTPCRFTMVAIYGLADVGAALGAWARRSAGGEEPDLAARFAEAEITCWEKRIDRLLARDVANPKPDAAAAEERARTAFAGSYMTQDALARALGG